MNFLTTPQVCELLHISKATLFKWIRDERLPYIQTVKGGKLLFDRPKIMKWLERREHPRHGRGLVRRI